MRDLPTPTLVVVSSPPGSGKTTWHTRSRRPPSIDVDTVDGYAPDLEAIVDSVNHR